MAMCSGALRKHLQAHHDLPKISLKTMAPVSVRAAGDLEDLTRTNREVAQSAARASAGRD